MQPHWNRLLIGCLAVTFLVAGLAIGLFDSWGNLWCGSLIRASLLLGAFWLGMPTKGRAAAWANFSPWWIIAIAVGMGDGLGAGDNTRAGLMTRGLAEITRLGVAMGGRGETFAGLTGMGDLIATCTSPLSRNRHVGVELGKGRHIDEIIEGMNMVAEGVKSAPTVMALAEKHGIAMPIASDVFDVTQGKRTAQEVFRGLLRSSVGDEAHPG